MTTDLVALRERFVSPPGPCPVCGAARVQDEDWEDSVERWRCPNVPKGPPPPPLVARSRRQQLDAMSAWNAATVAWWQSPEGEAATRHAQAAALAIWPDADVVAVIDRLAALEGKADGD